MPYIDLHSPDDYTSIYYRTSTPYGCVGGFERDRPTIIVLHQMFLDSSWLEHQFGDPRLSESYNIIAFDMRTAGQSIARPSGRHDSWVEAADLALCHQALHLPPCHILALEGIAPNCALRFAVLFPEMCLSLTMCNVPSPTELSFVYTAYDELLQTWCNAEDLDSFQHVGMESVSFVVGPTCDPDLRDEMIAFWEVVMPPFRRTRVVESLNVLSNRSPLKPEVYASIKQPILIFHGELNQTCPKKYSELLASQLTGAEGGTVLYTVKGAAGSLSIIPGSASIVNQVFARFLSRLPHVNSDLLPPRIPKKERMQAALTKLSEIMDDPSIATRNPLSSLSFSCLPPEIVKSQQAYIDAYRAGEAQAFSPLGRDGRPVRKYSERRQDHWFKGDKDGLSYTGANFLPNNKGGKTAVHREKPLPIPESDPIPTDVENRPRRPYTPSSVDQHIIKGSMAKVIGSAPTTSFPRHLRLDHL